MIGDAIHRLRPLYQPVLRRSPTLSLLVLAASGGKKDRPAWVANAYDDVWRGYRRWLDDAATLDQWLHVPGFDDQPQAWHLAGKVEYTSFDHLAFYTDLFVDVLRTYFPGARSVAEFGCGSGRNLLALKRRLPEIDFYGYELAPEGVEVGRAAAAKFGLDVRYAQLDYVDDGDEKYVHPTVDVAFTCYSLEQIPTRSREALAHIRDHVSLGSFHLEPVCENYPKTYRGLLGRVYTRQMDMLQGFDAAVSSLPYKRSHRRVLDTSQNPLMYPSLYILEK